ncbi:glycosyl transferase family 90-domain-containing protein [Mycena galopus ATCC 62051]|nr:glycosyl transferase family 90-domain-containing protein [Mycena galopus ATCC 62051]
MESTVSRPLLALAASSSHSGPRRRQRRARLILLAAAGTLVFFIGSTYLYFGPSAGLPIPEGFGPYYKSYSPHGKGIGGQGGNAPPPAHGHGDAEGKGWHPQPPPPPGHPAPLDADSSGSALQSLASASLTAFRSHDPPSLSAARARYELKTGRAPPRAYEDFYAFATAPQRQCLVDGYAGVYRDFAPFWRLEKTKKGWFRERVQEMGRKLAADSTTHGIAMLSIRDGMAHRPEDGATYFDVDWENTVNRFAAHLPPMTILISGRDEPRVVFDVGPLFEEDDPASPAWVERPPTVALERGEDVYQPGGSADISHSKRAPNPALEKALILTDPHPFALSPPDTGAFFSDPSRRDVCRPARGVGKMEDVPFLLSASSAEFTTDLVPILSMTKLADAPTSGTTTEGGGSCFADVLMPGEFFYRNSGWAGKFEHPDDVRWEDKKDVLYWRGKSNGGHIRGTNYLSFPRFRLMDLAAQKENVEKGLFDVRITEWHEWHCTDNCDPAPIRAAYNITGDSVPREEAYGYKYLLDVDGNTFSGRYLGLLRSGGLVFKSTAFAEFFTPWLIPYEHFIPVRPDLADLPDKIEWAKRNDAEAHRIQETGRVFAEQVLTDAQNDCYWFAVLMEWGALWGEDD